MVGCLMLWDLRLGATKNDHSLATPPLTLATSGGFIMSYRNVLDRRIAERNHRKILGSDKVILDCAH